MRNNISFKTRVFKPLILGSILLAAALAIISCGSKSDQQPNVILVMTDDQGYGDIGAHGSGRISTN